MVRCRIQIRKRALSGRPALAHGAGVRNIFSKCRCASSVLRRDNKFQNFSSETTRPYARESTRTRVTRPHIFRVVRLSARLYPRGRFSGMVFRQFERERIIRRNSGMSLSPVSILLLFTSPCLAPAITGSRTGVSG